MSYPRFQGSDIVHDRDAPRLYVDLKAIEHFMLSGEWYTHAMIHEATGVPLTSLPAQLCNLRKPHLGNWLVDKRHVKGGTWEYRLRPKQALTSERT